MFSDLDETIKALLVQAGGLDPAQIEVSFEIPNREWSSGIAKPTINCYLFDIRENRELRQSGMQVERNGTNGTPARRRAPLRLDLTYLITAWTRAVEDEHRLLWHALRTLMRFSTLPVEHLQGTLKEHELPVHTKLAQADSVLKSPGEFWTALENQLKPSLSYTVTIAVDRDSMPAGAPVLTAFVSLRQLEVEGAPSTDVRVGGVARTPDGAPITDAEVFVEGHGRPTLTDGEGRFTLRVPGAGAYTLVARAGTALVRREVQVPAPDYSLTLEPSEPPKPRQRARRGGGKGGPPTA
jgi:hypothetical protein